MTRFSGSVAPPAAALAPQRANEDTHRMAARRSDSVLRSLLLVLRREGVASTLRRSVNRVFVLNRFVLLARPLDLGAEPAELPPGCTFREIDRPELDRLRAGRTGLPADFYRDEIVDGERCFVITVHGALAYINWISERGASGFFRFAAGDAECAIVHTLPEYRGRGLHRLAQDRLVHVLAGEGKRRLLYAVHEGNPAGIKPLVKSGYVPVGTGYRIGTLAWSRMGRLPAGFRASGVAGSAAR